VAYRIVLFDVGNVLLKLKMPDFYARVHAACPALDAKAMEAELKRPEGTHLRYEVGQASFEDFHAELRGRYGLPWDRERFLREWQDYFEPNPPMNALLEKLKGKAALWALSNTNPEHLADFSRRFPIFGNVRQILASHELGFRKPDPRIFQKALDYLDSPASEIFFIDDLEANIQAARSCGMQAFHYAFNDAELRRALEL
jgi:HAD superfamily hydrolase (TIGR01509 family)